MKTILNKPELVSLLQQQLKDIDALCGEYDKGNKAVIHDISEKIAIIFNNSNQSKSLLSELKLTHLDLLCSSESYNSKSLTNFIGLLKLEHHAAMGWTYLARLDRSALVKVSYENWWSNKKLIIDSDGNAFTRAKIIKSEANDDPLVINTSGWKITDANGDKTTINPIPETIRQIAFELLESLRGVDLNKESKLHFKI
ncbi:hypothetical protein EV200_102436 [Pedobacter psychrotolerans]|uniref:Uncharacterized protein n=1 Tax=Pedobacter psychrotolerans TaxID=1843235 RepID=A0A4R2HJ10_9SPHI|nr:hypothetical protein [Pedobacter psychrotolerans]TCO29017.1 hypothetical protein EV200_102436 [Pedobacter psychrotolerans]GGE53488.1 hypothetical protein GCM10011413_19830 [Pedobacter psychrotolerans]